MDNIKQQKYPQGRIVPFPPTLEEQELVKEGRILIECAKWFGKDDVWLFGNAGPNRIASWNGIGVENGRVVRVDWYDEELVGMIPSALGELTELTYLFLGENYLEGQIPESFGRLRKLRQLNLSRNQLVGGIPFSFSQLMCLEELGLYNNFLSPDVPWYLGGHQLRAYLRRLPWGRAMTTASTIPYKRRRLDSLMTA